MAYPVIKIDSTDGTASDTTSSGAGPFPALTGTDASTSADGLTISFNVSVDLSEVVVDGSMAIFLNDSTWGHRNFARITGKDDGADTVDVSEAFTASLTGKTWGIGGFRASLSHAATVRLLGNCGAAGDAMPGWTIEFQSGHTETIGAQITWERAGDDVVGPITVRGEAGAATKPILTWSNNGGSFATGNRHHVKDLEFRNTSGYKTASYAIRGDADEQLMLTGLTISHETNNYYRAIHTGPSGIIVGCDIGYAADVGIYVNQGSVDIRSCRFHDCGSHGIWVLFLGDYQKVYIDHCVCDDNTGDGINYGNTNNSVYSNGSHITNCTIHNNGSDGIEVRSTSVQRQGLSVLISNCNLTKNGGYGLNFSGADVNDIIMAAYGIGLDNLNTGYNGMANSVGPVAGITTASLTNHQQVDPGYADAAGGDYSVGTSVKELGFPTAIIAGSATRSFVDIGAAQREEAGGGGGTTVPQGLQPIEVGITA